MQPTHSLRKKHLFVGITSQLIILVLQTVMDIFKKINGLREVVTSNKKNIFSKERVGCKILNFA